MNTNALKKFAREARIKLLGQVGRKLEYVLTADTAELRGMSRQIDELRVQIHKNGKEQVIEKVAYIWFNRLMALRFMDANGYNTPMVITPLPGYLMPEVLQEAKAGNTDAILQLDRKRLNDLLDGKTQVADAQTEAFKMLLIASCNSLYNVMPFMFERISDYTELLLPDDLLSDYSIVTDIRNGMTTEDCAQEEIIGWLYQFYISDKKDEVFEGLKKNIKIIAENIPAATQLFTPRWIVRYMVENTLGKLWLTLKPESKLREFMPYYIETSEGNEPTPLPEGVKGVTDIKFLDPCQGSGHVLVYAFDLFIKIYEEEGYNTNEIPALILENNLFGIDIDDRAAQLAAFALTMKARNYYSRFLRKPIQPHVIALENIEEETIEQTIKLPIAVGEKIINEHDELTLYSLTQAKNYGSLIQIDPEELKLLTIERGSIWEAQQEKLQTEAKYLAETYHCVVTNPPYMGGQGMNDYLRKFVDIFYKAGKADLMTCFMQRCSSLSKANCYYAMINLPSWLFLSSFQELRKELIKKYQIDSLLHMGRGIFGIDFGSVAFVVSKYPAKTKGSYFRLHQRNFQHLYYYHIEQLFLNAKNNLKYRYDFESYRGQDGVTEIPKESSTKGLQLAFLTDQNEFSKIPGNPIGYWLSENFINKISESDTVEDKFDVVAGISTGANSQYIFYWHEVKFTSIWDGDDDKKNEKPFKKHNKGGDVRKWYGNQNYIIKYNPTALDQLKELAGFRHDGERYYFKEAVSWSKITSSINSFRYYPKGFCFDSAGLSIFSNDGDPISLLGFLNTKVSQEILKMYNPTLNASPGVIKKLPYIAGEADLKTITQSAISISKSEWDSRETAFDFQNNEIIKYGTDLLSEAISTYKTIWSEKFHELHTNEEKLNAEFIKLFGLEQELTANVLLKEITILQEESKIVDNEIVIDEYPLIQQLVSYSVGCMFGRYSLDENGLILCGQGENLQDFLGHILNPSFLPDEDNIIPVLDGEYFTDDVVGKFKEFIKIAFSEQYLSDNLKFIEETLGKDIRKYFVKDFYNDHLKRYKKRPIYWMFSSPKGYFKALIYMHRYRTDTVSKLLNDYLRTYISKLESEKQSLNQTSI
ncbi:MAG: BREX-1 system adenine-specific DNA-methyltransferase PglX, partial [Bacteroidia bacterium]